MIDRRITRNREKLPMETATREKRQERKPPIPPAQCVMPRKRPAAEESPSARTSAWGQWRLPRGKRRRAHVPYVGWDSVTTSKFYVRFFYLVDFRRDPSAPMEIPGDVAPDGCRTPLHPRAQQQGFSVVSAPRHFTRGGLFLGLALTFATLALSFTSPFSSWASLGSALSSSDPTLDENDRSGHSISSLDFKVETKYTLETGSPQSTQYPWITAWRFAEPWSPASLVARGCGGDCANAMWKITGGADESSVVPR